MPTRNISLTDHLDDFVEKQVSQGRYGNASEVVREGLRRMEAERLAYDAKLAAINALAEEARADVRAGRVRRVDDIDAFMEAVVRNIDERQPAPSEAA